MEVIKKSTIFMDFFRGDGMETIILRKNTIFLIKTTKILLSQNNNSSYLLFFFFWVDKVKGFTIEPILKTIRTKMLINTDSPIKLKKKKSFCQVI